MIRPAILAGGAFGDASDGDARADEEARSAVAAALGIPAEWAWLHQVHGAEVVRATEPGRLGEGDAVFTTEVMLPIAVGVADCYPVIIEGDGGVGVAHAGWRGAAAGVVGALRAAMDAHGVTPVRAAVGPGIGSCCFEVGPEVLERFPGHHAATSWGTSGVDLRGALIDQLAGLDVWVSGVCTMSGDGYHSFRRDATKLRQVAVAWLPG